MKLFFGMGMSSSKVVSDVVSRSFQVVKPHVPSIKFRKSQTSATAGLKYDTSSSSSSTVSVSPSKSGTSTASPTATTIEYNELPSKYRRKPISAEEMEYIEKGGQV